MPAPKLKPLWDDSGRPLYPHRPCPVCDETYGIGSSFDQAECAYCGWMGSLTEMHSTVYPNMITQLGRGQA